MTASNKPTTTAATVRSDAERLALRRQVSLMREIFWPYDKVEEIQANMETLRLRENGASEGAFLKLFGPSRSGKTKIIHDYMRRFPVVEKGIVGENGDFADLMRVVCVRVPDTNVKNLTELLVAALTRRPVKEVVSTGSRRFDLQKDVLPLARAVGLQLLCLEETHDAIESRKDGSALSMARYLKDLVNDSLFGVVVSGTEATQRLFDLSSEIEGRAPYDHVITPFRWDHPSERDTFLDILRELDAHLKENVFGRPSGLTHPKIARPLLAAGGGVIGHAATLLESAATKAVDAYAMQVEFEHFIAAFSSSPLRRYVPDAFPLPSGTVVPEAGGADIKSGLRGRTRRAGRDVIFKR